MKIVDVILVGIALAAGGPVPSGAAAQEAAAPIHRYLRLDGKTAQINLPAGAFSSLPSATIEGWVRWNRLGYFSQPFGFGSKDRCLVIDHVEHSGDLQYYIRDSAGALHSLRVAGLIAPGSWYHIAATSGPGGMRLHVNGVLVAANDYTGSFPAFGDGADNHFGGVHWPGNTRFCGDLDEVRIWDHARTPAQIREHMNRSLTGREPGLAGLWNFDDASPRDSSPNARHGSLAGTPQFVEGPTLPSATRNIHVVQGRILEPTGYPVRNVRVTVDAPGMPGRSTLSDDSGHYRLPLVDPPASVAIQAAAEESGNTFNLQPANRSEIPLDLTLHPVTRISGKVTDYSGGPHPHIVVEALLNDAPAAQSITDSVGGYELRLYSPGAYQIRCRTPAPVQRRWRGGTPEMDSAAEEGTARFVLAEPGVRRQLDFTFAPEKKGAWRTFHFYDGLPSDSVEALLITPFDRIWAGSREGGLSLHNGSGFVELDRSQGLTHSTVRCLASGAGDDIYAGAANHVLRFNGDRFEALSPAFPAPEKVTALLLDSNGVLWAGTSNGLFRRQQDRWELVSETMGEPFTCLAEDSAGSLWAGTSGHGVLRRDKDGRISILNEAHGIPSGTIHSITRGVSGDMWVAAELGLAHWENGRFASWSEDDGLPDSRVLGCALDPAGKLWLATPKGLVCFREGRFLVYDERDGLIQSTVNSVAADRNGRIWAGTKAGLSVFDPAGVQDFGPADGLQFEQSFQVSPRSAGGVWIGTDGGLYHHDGQTIQREQITREPEKAWVLAVQETTDGRLWLGQDIPTAFTFQNGARIPMPTDYASGWAISYLETRDNHLWYLLGSGALRYEPTQSRFVAEAMPPGFHSATAFTTDESGAIWITGLEGMLARLRRGETPVEIRVDSFPGVTFLTTHWKAPHLWIGTSDGLLRLGPITNPHASAAEIPTRLFTTRDGLLHDQISDIHETPDGVLWIATGAGINLYDGFAWSSLDARDGLTSTPYKSICHDSAGALWFLKKYGGVTRFASATNVCGVELTGFTSRSSRGIIERPDRVPLGSQVDLQFRALDSFTAPEKQQYRHRFVRVMNAADRATRHDIGSSAPRWRAPDDQSGWSTPSRLRNAAWVPLEPGHYRFEVQAIDRSLNYSPSAHAEFAVVPLWHQSAWVRGSAVGGLLGVLWILYFSTSRYYAQRRETRRKTEQLRESYIQLQALFEEKQEILHLVAHNLRNPLWAMMASSAHVGDSVRAEAKSIQRFASSVQQGAQRMMHLVNNLLENDALDRGDLPQEPESFDLRETVDTLVTLYEVNAGQKQQTLIWRRPAAAANVHADPRWVAQVIENLLSNAIKFSPPNLSIEIDVECMDEWVALNVRDHGPGIPVAEQGKLFQKFSRLSTRPTGAETSSGLGLCLAYRLVQLQNGHLSCLSDPGKTRGATFIMKLPPAPRTSSADAPPYTSPLPPSSSAPAAFRRSAEDASAPSRR